jgi:predicted ATPase/DNA-binding SARP family transcriptional activator
VRFGILGPTRAWNGDDEVVIGGSALRALLALLLARPGEVVSVDSLVEDLYGDRLPGDAGHALQSQISRLRRALDGVTIESLSSGYRVSVGTGDVDAGEFERLAQEGRRALSDDHLGQAEASLAAALALWRGDPLADAPDAPSARALVQRLAERRLGATEDLVEVRLRLGDHQAVIAELRELVARHPLRERPQGLLLQALASAGEPAQALAVYAEFRQRLADELGAEPSTELQAIHLSLLRPGTDAPAARAVVPATLTSLVGRSEDVVRVGELLTAHRLVTLYGPGGVGKTRLATEVVAGRSGVCFVALDALRDGVEVAAALLAALGLRDSGPHTLPTSSPTARLLAALSAGSTLLVLDNCEHLVQAVAELAEQILTGCPRVRVLATSREALRVPGEHLWPVRPLDETAAMRLFADRAAAVHPGFVVDDGCAESVAEICRRLDGLPLAIELAAARVRTMDVAEIAAGLADRFALLSRGSRTAQPRHQTLRAAVAWSWDLLTDAERAVLRRLSVFAGGAELRAVMAMGGTAEVLDSLVDKSLLTVSGGRHRLLDTVAAYADERLAEAGESATTRRAHLDYYLALATEADPHLRGPDQLTWLGVLRAEQENLHAALRCAVTTGDVETALRLVAALATYLWMCGTRTVAGDLANAVLDQVTSPPPELANEYVLCVLAAAASSTGRAAYQRHIAAAQAIAVSAPRPLHPVTTFLRSMVGWGTDPEIHHALVQRGLSSADPWEAAAAHLVSGYPHLFVHADPAAAEREFVTAAEGFRALGERWGQSLTLGSLAGLADIQGEYARAIAFTDEALGLLRELGAVEELCDLHCDRGNYRVRLAVATGADPSTARADFEEAERMARRAGLPAYEAIAARGFADVAYLVGDVGLARRRYEQALADIDVSWIVGATNRIEALVGLARVAMTEADLDQATAHGLRAAELAVRIGMSPLYLRVVEVLTDIALDGGDPERAASLLGAAEALRGPAEAGPATARQAWAARLALGEEAFERLRGDAARLDQGAALRLIGVAPEIVAGSPALAAQVSLR